MKGLAVALIVTANVIGGLTYLGQQFALEALPPATIAWLRNLIALVCMGGWLLARGGIRWRFDRADLVRLTVLGCLAYAAPLVLGIVGVQWSTAANGSILILMEPGAILVFSMLLLGERIGPRQVGGVAIGFVGGLAIVLADEATSLDGLMDSELLRGNLVLALHAVLWGLFSPVAKPLTERHRSVDVTFAAMLLANLVLLPASLAEGVHWIDAPALLPALGWTALMGVLASFLGTVFWVEALRFLPASRIAPFTFLQPLAGVLGDWAVFDRLPSEAVFAGGALIAAGAVLVLWPTRARAAAA